MIPESIQVPSPTRTSESSFGSWTRRTSKACANCRRDKIKCDGGRPCSSCIKKRFACIDGCEPCRKARARCEEGRPCKRCLKEDLDCKDEPEPPPKPVIQVDMASAVAYPPGPSVPKSGDVGEDRFRMGERAKLACLSCRRDNKKCDDERPCRRCVSRGQDCIHVEKGPKQVKTRCNGCRQDSRKCEDARPCKNCVHKGVECTDTPRKGRGHGIRTKTACNTCRRDKVRCDGLRPCSTCTRKGILCVARPCTMCMQEGRSARACTHASELQPSGPYEDNSLSLQAPQETEQAGPAAASYQTMDACIPLTHGFSQDAGVVQHTPEVHVSHYPVHTGYHPMSTVHHYPYPPHADLTLMGSAQAYVDLPPGTHSLIDYPIDQTQGAHYPNFPTMESTYGTQVIPDRMESAERYV